jgi:phosphatidylglycerophosphate synthase
MTPRALISLGDLSPADGCGLPGLRTVGGIAIAERQARHAVKLGLDVVVVAAALPERLALRLEESGVRVAARAADAAAMLEGDSPVLVFQPGAVIDERLVAHMLQPGPPCRLLAFGTPRAGAERIDSQALWAGLAVVPAELARDVLRGLGDWELGSTLLRAAVERGAARLMVETLPLYAPARRRRVPFVWARPASSAECDAATDALLASAQKGCLDWPARWLHPPIENALTRLLLPTFVTPNMVTLYGAVLGVAATIAFARGQLLLGLVIVLLLGPIDGVDGKLARVRHEFSRWGDVEHILDKALEYSWYAAIAGWLFANGGGVAALIAAVGVGAFGLAEALQGEFFRRITGRQLDDWGQFERRMRLVASRRNTNFWGLLPFGLAGMWTEGMLAMLAFAFVTFVLATWRWMRHLGLYARANSATIAANWAGSRYDFLPRAPETDRGA